MKRSNTNLRNAFTLIDLLVIVAFIGLIVGLLFPFLAASKVKANRISCVNNLKVTFLGFKIWEGDNGDILPFAVSVTNGGVMELAQRDDLAGTFQIVSKQLGTTKTLVCPSDIRQAATNWAVLVKTNLSYFLNVDASEAYPGMIFMGDRNVIGGTRLTNGLTMFNSADSIRWGLDMHHGTGNVGLTDGSVAQMISIGLSPDLTNGITRLAIP